MKFLYENFLQFYLLALTSITQHKEKLLKYMKDIIKWTKKINYTNSHFDKNILNLLIEKIEKGEFD